MHFFELRNLQHFVLYLFPAVVSVLLIGAALAYSHFRTRGSEKKRKRVYYTFLGEIEERQNPFPLVLILIIVGTIIWGLLYTIGVGLSGGKI
jgi:hypothetical protein